MSAAADGAVVVVGGTSGIGRAIAEAFAARGTPVVITGRDATRAQEIAGEIGDTTTGIGLDLAEPTAIAERLASIANVRHLVLAAIERDQNSVREFDLAGALRLVTLKLVGNTEVIHTLVPRMTDDASILLFGGRAKDRPYPGSTTVSTVNGGVMGLVNTLAVELAPIRVNALHPGIVGDSPAWEGKPPAVLEAVRVRTPIGRLVTMAEVTAASIFLLENGAINGVNLYVDGGNDARVSEPATHHVTRAADITPVVPELYAPRSSGYTRAQVVGRHIGAVHTGLAVSLLAPDGHIDPHVHSLEESFHVLEGSPTLTLDGRDHVLSPDECGLIPVGVEHAWRSGGSSARWLEVMAPAPRVSGHPDTFFTGTPLSTSDGEPVDIRDPRARTFFRLTPDQMDLDRLKAGAPVDAPTVSASMATALLAYSGIALKMLVDQRLGAVLHTTFMVEYQHGGVAQPHDHPLEESYYIVDGEVEATAEGETIVLREGDIFWTGVGCVHSFLSVDPSKKVRWLESQSPQPPSNYSYRFNRDWDYLAARLSSQRAQASDT